MDNLFITIPAAFVVLLIAAALILAFFSRCAVRVKDRSAESREPYSCGEDFEGHLIQPDYSQFFSFALFFTILHVVALMIATAPVGTPETMALAGIYLTGAVVGLIILLRK
jgi:NADH:ubiquinone oxidoreductase subunit 3 (subunit A)